MVENEQSQIETEDKDYNQEFAFNIISIKKFWILYIFSLGLFIPAFSYLNWKRQNQILQEKISPFWRSFFGPISNFSLVLRIKEQSKIEKIKTWNATSSAILLLFIGFLYVFINDLYKNTPFFFTLILPFIKGLIYANWQKKINLSSGDENGLTNDKITITNILWILPLWALIVILIYIYVF